MSLYHFFLTLRARFDVFALLLFATVLAATTVSLLLPKTYKATVSLLVDTRDEQSLSNVLRPLINPLERMSYLQTQVDIITSEKVARKVIRELDLARNPKAANLVKRAAASGESVEDMLVRNLLKGLKVKASQSSVMHVSFSSPDAQLSADVANAIAKSYIDTMLELRVEPTREAVVWFDEQLKSLRTNLEDAQAKLTAYFRSRGIVSTDERFDVENTRLEALSEQVGRAQELSSERKSREQQTRDFLKQGGSPEKVPDVLDNAYIQKLKADVAHGEAELQELITQYGENHPQYQRQFSENRSLREKLDAEMKKIVAAIQNSAHQSQQHEANARKAMAEQRATVLDLKENRNELTVLRRNVESAERAYDSAMQRFVVSQVDSRASQTNVTVLNPAVVPHKPSQPKVALNIALSVVVGTLLGIGMVMLMEMFDRRVRSRGDLELGAPLLAVLNATQSGRQRLALPGKHRPVLPSAH
jgi:chain length determinant protein EpsF